MKREFDIAEEWICYELHPETPPHGKRLDTLFPESEMERMLENLRAAGQPYGISFSRLAVIANSRLAIEASEFARDKGRFEEAHYRFFKAYFQEGLNIGEESVILRLSEEIGLDRNELKDALDKGLYKLRLQQSAELARRYRVTVVPTFIINGAHRIVGSQPYRVFQKALGQLQPD